MNDEDRKYLTLAMSECWHKHVEAWITDYICRDCGDIFEDARQSLPRTFDTPEDFFAVWNWAQKQKWWHDYVMKADEIRFVRGRLKFGGSKINAPFPSAIAVFRPERTSRGSTNC